MTQTIQPIGETGFSWMKASVSAKKLMYYNITLEPITEDSHIIIIGITSEIKKYQKTIETTPEKISYIIRKIDNIGFMPFDYKDYFPNKEVYAIRLNEDFDFDAWARTQVEVPSNVDVSFVHKTYGNSEVEIVAKTLKKGRIIKVKEKIKGLLPFKTEAEAILKTFQKKAPAIPVDFDLESSEYSCHAYVSTIMEMMDATGHQKLKDWLSDNAKRKKNGYNYGTTSLTLPGPCIVNGKIEEITFTTSEKSNAIHCTIKLPGGHSLKDDNTGISVTLDAELPEIIISSMKSKNMNEIIELPWLSTVVVRTEPTKKDDKLIFRAFSYNVPFSLYDPVPLDETEIEARITNAFVHNRYDSEKTPRWTKIETALIPIFNNISRENLSIILILLDLYGNVALKDFGYENWVISSVEDRINAITQPGIPIKDLDFAICRKNKTAKST